MRDVDSLYHRLFGHPRMVGELVREFVPRKLVANVDFSGLQRINPKFHPARRSARRREADVIWRVPIRDGSDIDLYLLIEFQSVTDEWMAARAQVYQGLLWQQVIDERKLKASTGLPPLLLLVVYNGEQRWKVATTAWELITLSPDSTLWPWQPDARYYLLDMGAFSDDELAGRSSLAALLFRLERQHSTEELKGLVDEVIGWFRRHGGYERLRRLFTELIREAFARHRVKLPGSGSLLDMKSMLTIDNTAWHAQLLAKGVAKGLAEGKAGALISLLEERFGAVAPYRRKRIHGAKIETVERWFKRAIVAPNLQSVFDSRRRGGGSARSRPQQRLERVARRQHRSPRVE